MVESQNFMGRSIRMSWLLILTLVNVLFINLSEAQHEKKLPSAVVVGTVYCDTCFQQGFSKTSYFISDASVAVECGDGSSKPSFMKEVKTNKHGEFRVHLPFTVSKHVKRIKECSVKLISSSEPFCSVASRATSSSLHLKSRRQGVHIFSAGFFTFKPLKQPDLCNQKPSLEIPKELISKKSIFTNLGIPTFPSPPFTSTTPYLSPLPPLPSVPPLFPGLPKSPPPLNGNLLSDKILSKHQNVNDATVFSPPSFFPPIFPSPPPSFGIPNPFQPTPLLPPVPFQPPPPPPPPLFNLPPVPGLSPPPLPIGSPPPLPIGGGGFPPVPRPSPPPLPIGFPPVPRLFPPPLGFPPIPRISPPPLPTLPFPSPPFPFPPPGGFPGIPPASSPIKISSP